MTVSALVLTLDAHQADQTIARLARDSRLILGQPVDHRLPVVAETASLREGRDLCLQLEQTPGVLFVSLVRVAFPDEDTP
jgi:hypothetical protein